MLKEIEGFVAGIRDQEAELDRLLATVLFTDIVDSTKLAAELGDRRWQEVLEAHNARIRSLLGRFRGQEVDTAGDGFLATFDGPIRAVRCALTATQAVRVLGVEIRAGLHTGEVDVSAGKVRGIAVQIGARVAALAGRSQVLTSSTVKDVHGEGPRRGIRAPVRRGRGTRPERSAWLVAPLPGAAVSDYGATERTFDRRGDLGERSLDR